MRVIVTGSAGFIGSHIAGALEARGDDVVGIDKKNGPEYDLSVTDAYFIAQADAIVHCAGSASTPGSVSKPIETFTDNVVTAANILEAARRANIPLIITSSVKARDGMTPYGAAKRMVELWALEYKAAYDLPIIINRPGTVYGPGQEGSTESGWIAWFLKAKREGLPVVINGDGSNVRDLLHVSDYVRLVLTQLDDPILYAGAGYYYGPIYDVGGGPGNAVTVGDMADYLGLEYTFGPPRYGDAERYVADNDFPDWRPEIGWRQGIEELLAVPA